MKFENTIWSILFLTFGTFIGCFFFQIDMSHSVEWANKFFLFFPSWLTKLTASITWPVTIIIIFIWSRRDISFLIKSLPTFVSNIKAKFGPAELEMTTQQYRASEKSEDVLANVLHTATSELSINETFNNTISKKVLEKIPNKFIAEELIFVSALIRGNFLENAKDFSPNEKNDYLIALSSLLGIFWTHERQYRLIFGSQIYLLKKLREASSLRTEKVQEIYNQVQTKFPEFYKTFSYQNWLGYLLIEELCAQDALGNVLITNAGKGFLLYIFDQNLTEDKAW